MVSSELERTLTGIRLRRAPDGARGFAATVELIGVHDLVMTEMVNATLAPLRGDVLVDLRRCSSIDSATIAVLVGYGLELAQEGWALELIAPPKGSSAEQALRQACIGDFLTIQRLPCEPEPVEPRRAHDERRRPSAILGAPRCQALPRSPGVRRRHACQLRHAYTG